MADKWSSYFDYDINTMLDHGTGVSWCEAHYKYTVHSKIAEFFNTVSNLPLIVLPLIGIFLQKEYLNFNKFAKLSYALVSVIGVMSTYYHATLSLCGQILDELSIFWGLMACYVAWLPTAKSMPPWVMDHVGMWRIFAVVFSLVSSVICFVRPSLNNYMMFIVLCIPTYFVVSMESNRIVGKSDSGAESSLARRGLGLSMLGMFVWVLDKFACPLWLSIGFPYLHAIWHALMGIGGYHLLVFYSYLDAKEHLETDECEVVIRWVPHFKQIPSIPYIHLQHKSI